MNDWLILVSETSKWGLKVKTKVYLLLREYPNALNVQSKSISVFCGRLTEKYG